MLIKRFLILNNKIDYRNDRTSMRYPLIFLNYLTIFGTPRNFHITKVPIQ